MVTGFTFQQHVCDKMMTTLTFLRTFQGVSCEVKDERRELQKPG